MIARNRRKLNRRFVPSEKNIQNLLYLWLVGKGHISIVPNCGAFGWEADLISFTKKGTGIEYEIKISVQDFKADAKKKKHKRLKHGDTNYGFGCPHKFYYVVPQGLICVADVPSHAGLIWVHEKYLEVLKPAPKLHNKSVKKRVIEYINRGLMLRYWSQRAPA